MSSSLTGNRPCSSTRADGGGSLPTVVRDALALWQRWNDGSYLARIVFCQMIRHNEVNAGWASAWGIDGHLGYGISSRLEAAADADRPVIALNADRQDVSYLIVEDASRIGEDAACDVQPLARWSMSDYVQGSAAAAAGCGHRVRPGSYYQSLSRSGRSRRR